MRLHRLVDGRRRVGGHARPRRRSAGSRSLHTSRRSAGEACGRPWLSPRRPACSTAQVIWGTTRAGRSSGASKSRPRTLPGSKRRVRQRLTRSPTWRLRSRPAQRSAGRALVAISHSRSACSSGRATCWGGGCSAYPPGALFALILFTRPALVNEAGQDLIDVPFMRWWSGRRDGGQSSTRPPSHARPAALAGLLRPVAWLLLPPTSATSCPAEHSTSPSSSRRERRRAAHVGGLDLVVQVTRSTRCTARRSSPRNSTVRETSNRRPTLRGPSTTVLGEPGTRRPHRTPRRHLRALSARATCRSTDRARADRLRRARRGRSPCAPALPARSRGRARALPTHGVAGVDAARTRRPAAKTIDGRLCAAVGDARARHPTRPRPPTRAAALPRSAPGVEGDLHALLRGARRHG